MTKEQTTPQASNDDFFDTAESRRRGNSALIAFGAITLLVLAVPLIWAFTDWL